MARRHHFRGANGQAGREKSGETVSGRLQPDVYDPDGLALSIRPGMVVGPGAGDEPCRRFRDSYFAAHGNIGSGRVRMSCLCLLAEVLDKEAGSSLMEFISVFIGGFIGVVPNLLFWMAAIILTAIMLHRGGGRAERFIIAGASLGLFSSLLGIPAAAIVPWLVQGGAAITDASSAAFIYEIVRDVVGMTGIICLVYGFWVKFKMGNEHFPPQGTI
jgi:hypothetical protein